MEEEIKQEPTIKDLLAKLVQQNEKLEQNKEVKKWKIPWKSRVNKAKIAKGYATVQIIRNNGEMDFVRAPIDDGTITIDGIPRMATIDYKLTYKGKPFIIQPEWSLKPFSAVDNYEDTVKEKMNIAGRKVILAKLEKEVIKPKKGIGGAGGWIILIIIIAIGAYMLFKGGKIF